MSGMAGPLDNITVVDLSRVMAAPFATQMLSDFGATVWKVEALTGDHTREWGSHYFDAGNRGKRSLAVNLKDERGQRIVRSLAEKADVFVENFKPGDLRRYGLDYERLRVANERLVYLSVTGFGQNGPRKDQLGYDTMMQALTGLMSLTGGPDRPPAKVGIPLVDIMAGLTGAVGVFAALYERVASGQGQYIDLSLYDVGIMSLIDAGLDYLQRGNVQTRLGSVHRNFAPAQPFETADGWLIIAIGTDEQFRRLCEAMELPGLLDDVRFKNNAARLANREALVDVLSDTFSNRPRSDWMDAFEKAKVPSSPIHDIADAISDPQTAARNMVWRVDASDGTGQLLASPLQHMSRTPAVLSGAPPNLGEHTVDALGSQLGMAETEIKKLVRDNVIRIPDDSTDGAKETHD